MAIQKVVIISTYPEHDSKNIGDYLITQSLSKLLRTFNPEIIIEEVWRAAAWEEVSKSILEADHVFFACLAIRDRMEENVYPYIQKVLESGVPFSAIASGTDLPVHGQGSVYQQFTDATKALLKDINRRASCFTTRGVLSQGLCDFQGLDRALFSGDVAFYEPDFSQRTFPVNKPIKEILVSDPHMPRHYINSLHALLVGLTMRFPEARIRMTLHSVNPVMEEFCRVVGVEAVTIHEDKVHGLDIYDEADLHVGYRVHAHVSALKRRVYSYLIEQDGRGCDYGLTLARKISVPDYAQGRPQLPDGGVAEVDQLLAVISQDRREEFTKFAGLEEQIERFNRTLHKEVEKLFVPSES